MPIASKPALPLNLFFNSIASKLELPLSLLLSTPNPDPDRFKTCTTFKPIFQIPIASKPVLPLSLSISSYFFNLQINFERVIPFIPFPFFSLHYFNHLPQKT
jgi:hypothetical protein